MVHDNGLATVHASATFMFTRRFPSLAFCPTAILALTCGCSAASGGGGSGGDAGGAGAGSGGMAAGGSGGSGLVGGSGGSGGGLLIDAATGGGPPTGPSEVYGHGPDELYRLDPDTKQVQVIGPFDGCSTVWDIAIDKDSKMFATTETALWRIDPTTAKCQLIASGGPFPNSLSFVPAGTLDPSAEVLVGYEETDYVRVHTTTGAIEVVNAGALTDGLVSSGDIVSVIGGATYLTVKAGACSVADCLVEIDPKTGAVLKNWGSVSHKSVFGLGFWAGAAYGFTSAGQLFQIDFSTTTVSTTPIAIPSAPVGLKFWGAGSTTAAPPLPR